MPGWASVEPLCIRAGVAGFHEGEARKGSEAEHADGEARQPQAGEGRCGKGAVPKPAGPPIVVGDEDGAFWCSGDRSFGVDDRQGDVHRVKHAPESEA
jgi:hypothetical protein